MTWAGEHTPRSECWCAECLKRFKRSGYEWSAWEDELVLYNEGLGRRHRLSFTELSEVLQRSPAAVSGREYKLTRDAVPPPSLKESRAALLGVLQYLAGN